MNKYIVGIFTLNYIELLSNGPEPGHLFKLVAKEENKQDILEDFEKRIEPDTGCYDYLTAKVIATDTNGVVVRPGDLVVYTENAGSFKWEVSVVTSPSGAVKDLLLSSITEIHQ